MTTFTFRPIDTWPGDQTRTPQRSRFGASWSSTDDLLERELAMLKARNVVIQLALDESDIRIDGKPRANARPRHQGVILAFDSRYGPLKYATDTFDRWQDNLRAIALGLEALRKVDRYGITKRGEQYTGWKALPSGTPGAVAMTPSEAARLLAVWGLEDNHESTVAQVAVDPKLRAEAYRKAAKRMHPARGGHADDFRRLQDAKAVLEEHLA